MKLSKKKILVVAGLIVLTFTTRAQVKISGEVRPRAEYRHGFKTLHPDDIDPAFFTEQRTRLRADYNSDKFKVVLSLQDVRIWGAVNQIYKSDPSLTAIHEGYAAFKFNPKVAISVGRMELNYDNARFLGNLGWAQQSRSHDLALFTITDSTWVLHFGAAFNQDSNTPEFGKLKSTYYTGVNNYKTMQYAWFHKDISNIGLSFLFLNNGVQVGTADSSDVNFSQTLGFFGNKKKGDIQATLETYYQMGKDVAGKDMSAYMFGTSFTYSGLKKLPLTLGVDHLSGIKSGETKNTAFNPMYGTNHKFYGFMDYFYVGNGHKNVGLTDIYLKTVVKTSKSSALIVNLHQFFSAVDIMAPAGVAEEFSKSLGTEIDLVFNLNLSKSVNFKVGYSQLFASKSMEVVKGVYGTELASVNNWAWAMLTFKPVFFEKK